jgi:hypothetical protein
MPKRGSRFLNANPDADLVDFSISALTHQSFFTPHFSITETVYLSIKITLCPAEAKKRSGHTSS